ncbi:MAG TPA: hypothetical protein VMF06_22360 [Candidatus Limnocylindria bacterium]|nr:hypothetical protein [Candidatus Limnocylindria bacterium]
MVNRTTTDLGEIPMLLRGDPVQLRGWLADFRARRGLVCVAVIVAGAALYGAAMGCWRAPEQALYTAIKFPLVLLATTVGNALLNGVLAPLLGLQINFRQSTLAILMSQTIAVTILAAFSPLVFFTVWNLPPMATPEARAGAFAFLQVTQVLAIAFAGTTANVHLFRLLRSWGSSASVARNVLVAWLAGNLLLGTQLTWILRPFFGSPHLAVQFLRADALRGNFFESVAYSITYLFR